MSNKKYALHLTEKQARVIINALDLYSRIGMGQLKEVAYVLRHNPIPASASEAENRSSILIDIKDELDVLSKLWMNGSGYHSINSSKISDVFRIAWDIQQVIRHRLAWDRNPKGEITVDFDTPLVTSDEVLPKIVEEQSEQEIYKITSGISLNTNSERHYFFIERDNAKKFFKEIVDTIKKEKINIYIDNELYFNCSFIEYHIEKFVRFEVIKTTDLTMLPEAS